MNEYDASGVLSARKFDIWSDSKNQFFSYSKVENEVVDGKVVVSSIFFRNQVTGIWRRIRKVQNFYNSSGLIEEEIHQKFVSAANELVNAKKYTYTYDSQSRLQTKNQLEWIDSLNEFRNKNQEKYSYDDLWRVHTHTDLTWEDSSSVWNPYRRKVDYYASDLSLDSVYYYFLNSNGEELRRIDRVQFNADSTILSATQMSWDTLTNSWQLGDFQRWYYEGYDTLVPEDPFFLSIFPNPTTESIFIGKGAVPEGLEVFIYSEDGKLMVAKELKQSNKIYMEDWAAAVYFYVLYQDGRRISSGSILKQ